MGLQETPPDYTAVLFMFSLRNSIIMLPIIDHQMNLDCNSLPVHSRDLELAPSERTCLNHEASKYT